MISQRENYHKHADIVRSFNAGSLLGGGGGGFVLPCPETFLPPKIKKIKNKIKNNRTETIAYS